MTRILGFFVFILLTHPMFSQQDQRLLIQNLQEKINKVPPDSDRVSLMNELTWCYWNLNNINLRNDTVSKHIADVVTLARHVNYLSGLAEALYNSGKYHLSITHQLTLATPELLESMSLYDQLKDKTGISKCYLQLGLISFTLQYFEDALKKLYLSRVYSENMTAKYLMAICYSELDSADLARSLFNESIMESKETNNTGRLIECYMYLGRLQIKSSATDSGIHYIQLALNEIYKLNDSTLFARPFAFISKAYLLKGDTKKAIYYADNSFKIAKIYGDPISLSEAAETLNKAHSKLGNYQKAYYYLNEMNVLRDSVFRGSTQHKIADMQSNFEFEKAINDQKSTQEKVKAIANEQLKKQTIIRNALLAGTLLLLLLLVLVYNRFVIKRKANNDLTEKNRIISAEKERSENLLLNILPAEVAEELKATGKARARQFENVTVLFTDFVNFTGISEEMEPSELVQELHNYFTVFDKILEKNGLEKIKTIGDAYLAVCGMPQENASHAILVTRAAKEIREYISHQNPKFQIRIGIHSGAVIAGIVGVKKFAYDIWGDTVNTAARMEQSSEAGKINISGYTYELIKNEFPCTYRGKIKAKNKGEIDMYYVN